MMLVTGFGPYRENINASGELVRSLQEDPLPELKPYQARTTFEIICITPSTPDDEHRELEGKLRQLLEKHKPHWCLFTGQAPTYSHISIETVASNSFMKEPIDIARPHEYRSNLPGMDSLKQLMDDNNIPAKYSSYCGQHVCNHILYSSLYFAEKHALPHKSGFIHVPVLPKQTIEDYINSPSMPLTFTRQALALSIQHIFANGHHSQ